MPLARYFGIITGWIRRMLEFAEKVKELHLRDDDEHGLDCKGKHGQMINPNPEGCEMCRLLKEAGVV